jgi:hypothetical protein
VLTTSFKNWEYFTPSPLAVLCPTTTETQKHRNIR